MDWLSSDHVVTPTEDSRNNRGVVFTVRGRRWEDIEECRNGNSVQLSAGDSHGKFVVEEELEVGLWRLSVWLEDLVTVRLF
jgi:hypothetical protein